MSRAAVLLAVFLGGCAGTSSSSSSSTSSSSGGVPAQDGGVEQDAGNTTALAIAWGSHLLTLNRAQLGLEPADGGPFLYVEAHLGGAPECPSNSSPTPDQTFILANLPSGGPGSVYTMADGVRGTLFDFAGTLWTDIRPASAVTVQVTVVQRVTEPAASAFVVLDVNATFDGGTLSGRLAAPHCDSLDGP